MKKRSDNLGQAFNKKKCLSICWLTPSISTFKHFPPWLHRTHSKYMILHWFLLLFTTWYCLMKVDFYVQLLKLWKWLRFIRIIMMVKEYLYYFVVWMLLLWPSVVLPHIIVSSSSSSVLSATEILQNINKTISQLDTSGYNQVSGSVSQHKIWFSITPLTLTQTEMWTVANW